MIELSAVMLVSERRERAVHALRTLLSQDVAGLEILIVDLAADVRPPLYGSDDPRVRVIPMPATTLFSAARYEAVCESRGPIVAFVEEHSYVFEGWAAALIEAFRGPWAGVGAEVHNANPEAPGSHALALMNYHPWLAPARAGEVNLLPGHNSAYRKDVLLSYGPLLKTLLRSEMVLSPRLIQDGHRLYLEPRAKFAHINEASLESISRGYFLWHRSYGPARAQIFNWSAGRRLMYILATPVTPLYYVAKLSRTLLRNRRDLLPVMLRHLHRIVFAQWACAAGQAVGLLFGPGDSEKRFTWFEMNEPRPLPDHPGYS